MSRRPLPIGAPSIEAHEALVDCALSLIRLADPALEEFIVIRWMPRATSTFGAAMYVPEGAWFSSTAWWSGTAHPGVANARRATQPVAVLSLSAVQWGRMAPWSRGETIAHELAHLSHERDAMSGLIGEAAWRKHYALEPHGNEWTRWCYRYAGRPLATRGSRRELTGEAADNPGAVEVGGVFARDPLENDRWCTDFVAVPPGILPEWENDAA